MKQLVILIFIANSLADRPNTCDTVLTYAIRDLPSSGCSFNQDVITDMPKLVKNHKYPVEEYKVTTKDGYILTVFRLPNRKPKGVVYLLHPATASCTVWVDKGPRDSLGLAFYDAGYDVWLGNSRGTFYSRNHTHLNPNSNAFWDFSYHEMGIFDLPATIELISSKSNSKNITFIGHSMSGTAAVIYASLMPEHAAKYISVFISHAPLVYAKHLRTPIKYLAVFADLIYSIAEKLNLLETMPLNRKRLINQFCGSFFFGIKQCVNVVQIFFGPDKGTFNYPQIPIMWGQNPAGLSLKCAYHYAQSINAQGKFQYFDYKTEGNLERYNSTTPPLYPIENIRSSFYLIAGSNDYIADEKDIVNFQKALPQNSIKLKVKSVKGYNHGHFAYGKNLRQDIIEPLLKFVSDWMKGSISQYV